MDEQGREIIRAALAWGEGRRAFKDLERRSRLGRDDADWADWVMVHEAEEEEVALGEALFALVDPARAPAVPA